MKKIVFLYFFLLPMMVCAQVWDGTNITAPTLSGSTYLVSTGSELAWIAQESRNQTFEGKTITMLNDIDLGDGHNWIPISNGEYAFEGTFDGQCHTIKRFNIFYTDATQNLGLFSKIGNKGKVQNLAIESGKIFISEVNNVGALVGENNGTVSQCFSMIQILANACNNVGGLIGLNKGNLNYSYQAGYISDAGNNSGGLIGSNEGTVQNCYVSGYTLSSGSNCGSVVGVNNGTFTNTYFDQQLCLQKASSKDEEGINSITETKDMYRIFRGDNHWYTTTGWYPQLQCFASTSPDASIVSVVPVLLPTDEAPIQRGESITKNFQLCTDSNTIWTSSDNDVIKISYNTGMITRQCSKRTIIVTANKGNSKRGVLLQVTGFNTFDPGIIGGTRRACHGDGVKFADRNRGAEILDAVGGRDDDKKQHPYSYLIEQYQLFDHNNDGEYEDTVLFKTYHLDSNNYSDFLCDTQHDGHWIYRRYVHDSQCQLEYQRSQGEMLLIVFSWFDPGELTSQTDTIYGDYPKAVHIESAQDADGGEGPYMYRWFYTHLQIDYLNNDTTVKTDSVHMKYAPDTCVLDTTVFATGEYFFYRAARDLYCNRQDYASTRGYRHFVVFDSLKAGEIETAKYDICAGDALPKIKELTAPTGGNGIYSYRWLINNQVLDNQEKPDFNPDSTDISLTAGSTYTLIRQVKDNTGLMDWTDSEGGVKVHVHRNFVAGSIREQTILTCLETKDINVPVITRTASAALGDSTINYRWQLLTTDSTKKVVQTLTINKADLNDTLKLKIALPASLYLKRQAQNPVCSNEWYDSEGLVTLNIDSNRFSSQTLTLCRENMPYTGSYTFSGGETQTYRFTTDGEQKTISGKSLTGCTETVQFICHLTEVPDAEVDPIGVVCQTDTLIYIRYHVTQGHPNHYNITYNDAAYNAGFTDRSDTLSDPNYIIIPIGAVPLGEFTMYLQFIEQGQAIGGCKSNTSTLNFSVNLGGFVHQKWNDVLYIDNNNKNGFPSAENDLMFNAYQWYKDGEIIEGANGQVYNEEGGLNGEYYALITDTDGNQYKTCPLEVRPPSGLENTNVMAIYPNVLNAGEKINIALPQGCTLQIIAMDGKIVTQSNNQSIYAPANAGIYIVRFISQEGEMLYNHIIVK